jgi:hypothetical protein
MLVAMFTTFAASKKEPLAEAIGRIHAGFLAAGFGEPSVRFSLADAPVNPETGAVAAAMGPKRISSVCGKVRKTVQIPMAVAEAQGQSEAAAQADGLEKREAIRSVVREYRAKIPKLLESLPHDLPDRLGEAGTPPAFETSRPKKPELTRAFATMGYSCLRRVCLTA